MAKVDTGGQGLIQFDNLADPFGPGSPTQVRNRYQWTVEFGPTANLTGGVIGSALGLGGKAEFYIKTTDLPRVTIETQTLNQYNIRRNINTHVSYEPLTMTFYDTKDNGFQKFLESYLNFKFKNWENAQNVRAPFGLGPGYAPEFGVRSPKTGFAQGGILDGANLGDQSLTSTLNDNFLSHIVIKKEMKTAAASVATSSSTPIQVPVLTAMGDVTGFVEQAGSPTTSAPTGTPTDASASITLYNPKLVDISQDQLDYADGGSVLTWTVTFRYESYGFGGPKTTDFTAIQGVSGDVARGVQEVGRSVGRFFENVIRRIF